MLTICTTDKDQHLNIDTEQEPAPAAMSIAAVMMITKVAIGQVDNIYYLYRHVSSSIDPWVYPLWVCLWV